MTETTSDERDRKLDELKAKLAADRPDRIARKHKHWNDFDAGRGVKSDATASVALLNQRLAGALVDESTTMIRLMAASKYEMLDAIAECLAKAIGPLMKRVSTLEAQIEQRKYVGVWDQGTAYLQHNMVSYDGSVWFAKANTGSKPGTDGTWQLAVKKGRNGRDAVGAR